MFLSRFLFVASCTYVLSEGPLNFFDRPKSFREAFPSRESFQLASGRRLKAEGPKPERLRFDFEEDGRSFQYEIGSDTPNVNIVDVDRELAVDSVACEMYADGAVRVWLKWSSTVPPLALRVSDVITGGAEWGCGGDSEGFLVQIARVEPCSNDSVTVLSAWHTSPFEVFQNLYVDFSWSGGGGSQHGGRQLLAWSHDQTMINIGYNYDNATQKAANVFQLFPFTCGSCYANLQVAFQIQLETTGAAPTRAVFKMGGGFHAEIDLMLGISGELATKLNLDSWTTVLNSTGFDLLSTIAMTIPIFNLVNSQTLNLKIRPIYSMGLKGDLQPGDLGIGERFQVSADTNPTNTYFQVEWTPEGYLSSANFQLTPHAITPGFYSGGGGRHLLAGLRFCVGLEMTAGNMNERLSSLELCPEFWTLCTQCAAAAQRRLESSDFAARVMASRAILAPTSSANDAKLCIDIQSFTTNTYGDILDFDGWAEPFVEACFFGKCVRTTYTNTFGEMTDEGHCRCSNRCGILDKSCYVNRSCSVGKPSNIPGFPNWAACDRNRVDWIDGPSCLDVPSSSFDLNNITWRAMEHDPFFDDFYTTTFPMALGGDCKTAAGCNVSLNLTLRARFARLGSKAKLVAHVSLHPLRRAESKLPVDAERELGATCPTKGSTTDVSVQVGLSTSFGGFTYPSSFSRGAAQTVIDPVQGPSIKPKVAMTFSTGSYVDKADNARLLRPSSSDSLMVLLLFACLAMEFGCQ